MSWLALGEHLSAAGAWVAATAHDPAIREEAAAWRRRDASYPALVRLCARAVLAFDARWPPARGASRYRDKVEGELESMLDMWPDVVLLPTAVPLAPLELIELRAFPVHPLGLADRPTWTDGALDSPSEFFFHDLDHARFKVREDLLADGVDVPDAYHDGETFDPETRRHRFIMAAARTHVRGRLWGRAASRLAVAQKLRGGLNALGEGALGAAAALLLFEIVHEKSFPLESAVLDRELARDAHLAKLEAKVAKKFFSEPVDDAVVAALPAARAALREMLA